MSLANLEALPEELIARLLIQLGYRDLINLGGISKKYWTLYRNPNMWVEKIISSIPYSNMEKQLRNLPLYQLVNFYRKISTPGLVQVFANNEYGKYDLNGFGFLKINDPVNYPGLENIKIIQIASSDDYMGAITEQGKLYIKSRSPTKEFTNISQVACGRQHMLFLTKGGQVYAVGNNRYGQLGLGDDEYKPTPKKISQLAEEKVIQVSCGDDYTALVTDRGYLYVFGRNNIGQLGLGDDNDRNIPIRIPGLENLVVTQVSCGSMHTIFTTDQGYVYAMGSGCYGQLGLGEYYRKQSVPIRIPHINNIVQISCGEIHTALIDNQGDVYVFGYNYSGQLGVGDYENRNIPTKVLGVKNVFQVSAGRYYTTFVTYNDRLYITGTRLLGDPVYDDIKQLPMDNVSQVVCDRNHTIFIQAAKNDIWSWQKITNWLSWVFFNITISCRQIFFPVLYCNIMVKLR